MELKDDSILDRIKLSQKYFKTGIITCDHHLPQTRDTVLGKTEIVY